MTTQETLAAEREERERQRRIANRKHARGVLAGILVGHAEPIPEDDDGRYLWPDGLLDETEDLLQLVGLLDPEDEDGVGVLMPHAFNEPGAKASLSAPAAGVYR